jgi:hypothetical protein
MSSRLASSRIWSFNFMDLFKTKLCYNCLFSSYLKMYFLQKCCIFWILRSTRFLHFIWKETLTEFLIDLKLFMLFLQKSGSFLVQNPCHFHAALLLFFI